ncbi:MAG TPA: ATP-binding protein [Anaerolineales bacterium]|nr:ATP-binding protein [Anaerolineales bacterium]
MKPARVSFLRGITVQLLAITVLPLTLLLLLIAFGSVSLHQQDMRALVGERDERAVQAAAAALASELHHREASITHLAQLAEISTDTLIHTSQDILLDFDGGLAYLTMDGQPITSTGSASIWQALAQSDVYLEALSDREPLFTPTGVDPETGNVFVVVFQAVPSRDMIVAGAFSPDSLAGQILSTSYPDSRHVTIFLLDASRRVLFSSGPLARESIPAEHPGIQEALQGQSGTTYVTQGNVEHVVAYSPIAPTGWALITEEEWEMVTSPSLQLTQMAPLVIVPAFLLALLALWFVASRIVQPLQRLESKAAALAWGDFEAIREPVGGISEVQHLQMELTEMSRKVQAAQEGLHDYIGAITAAQEEERSRLARELHDDTIQAVIALKQRVQLAQQTVSDSNGRKSLRELEELAEQTVENLRRLTRALRPIYLEDLGLVTALDMLARETHQTHSLVVEFHKEGQERRLTHEVELALYRIAQEALHNVVKHSGATQAGLKIAFDESQIRMDIWDNGKGFDMPRSPTDFASLGHFGLLGIRERADLMGARLEVDSVTGQGTRLTVRL